MLGTGVDSGSGGGQARLTSAQWAERLGVEAKGHADGGGNKPPSDATELSSTEREVVRNFEGAIRARQGEHSKRVDSCHANMAKIFNDSTLESLHGLPAKLTTENLDSKAEESKRLEEIRTNARARELDLKKFKEENKLVREARPQQDILVRVSWIGGIVAVETLLNATFFAAGSERGLLGGAIQAFVISFINVYAAWFCGKHCVPRLNHIKPGVRATGLGGTLLVAGLILVLNIFAGHYRAALEQDPFLAVIQAVLTFRQNFLGIESAQGWLLTGVGLVASTGLSTKIYMSDDPYPGYGEMYRLHKEAQDEWIEAQAAFIRRMKRNYDRVEAERRTLTDRLTDLELQCRKYMDIAHQAAEDFRQYALEQESVCNHVINVYRTANQTMRNTPAPSYFNETVSMDVSQYSVIVDFSKEQERFEDMTRRFAAYRDEESMLTMGRLRELHDRTIETIDSYFNC